MKFLSHDPFTGITRHMGTDEMTGVNVVKSTMDVEPTIDYIKQAADCWDPKRNMWYVGSIPPIICELWAQESKSKVFSKEWQKYAAERLNLPDYRKLNPNKIRLKT